MRTRHLPLRKCRSTVNHFKASICHYNFICKVSELHCHEESVQLLPYIHKALHTRAALCCQLAGSAMQTAVSTKYLCVLDMQTPVSMCIYICGIRHIDLHFNFATCPNKWYLHQCSQIRVFQERCRVTSYHQPTAQHTMYCTVYACSSGKADPVHH